MCRSQAHHTSLAAAVAADAADPRDNSYSFRKPQHEVGTRFVSVRVKALFTTKEVMPTATHAPWNTRGSSRPTVRRIRRAVQPAYLSASVGGFHLPPARPQFPAHNIGSDGRGARPGHALGGPFTHSWNFGLCWRRAGHPFLLVLAERGFTPSVGGEARHHPGSNGRLGSLETADGSIGQSVWR
jgi:hypothetical protein